ncbi:hypothetical protein HELRODRAFT_189847 [Helobdella robusta]|uniref:Neurogenic mastermind-like N-terminal domain-containing protein n=1 Tax=Helobdella robusta TaxID=6412 RepID=T1FRF2_HELRO|nr:hypothetical protein HELRODRAFT_189847 [Helobdella robusta]ESN90372.1 hypothetical protein HELRODRAFT_189847 [Helobdella robusta]
MNVIDQKPNHNDYGGAYNRFHRRMDIYRSHHEQNYKKYLPVWAEEVKLRREETNQLYKRWLEQQAKTSSGGKSSKVDTSGSASTGVTKKVKRKLSNNEGNQTAGSAPIASTGSNNPLNFNNQSNVDNFRNTFKHNKISKMNPHPIQEFNFQAKVLQNSVNNLKSNHHNNSTINIPEVCNMNKSLKDQPFINTAPMPAALMLPTVPTPAENSMDNKMLEEDFDDIKDLFEFLNSDEDIPEDILRGSEKEIMPQNDDSFGMKVTDHDDALSNPLSGYRSYIHNFLAESTSTDFIPNLNESNQNDCYIPSTNHATASGYAKDGASSLMGLDPKTSANTSSTALEGSTKNSSPQQTTNLNFNNMNVTDASANFRSGLKGSPVIDSNNRSNNNSAYMNSMSQYSVGHLNGQETIFLPRYNDVIIADQSVCSSSNNDLGMGADVNFNNPNNNNHNSNANVNIINNMSNVKMSNNLNLLNSSPVNSTTSSNNCFYPNQYYHHQQQPAFNQNNFYNADQDVAYINNLQHNNTAIQSNYFTDSGDHNGNNVYPIMSQREKDFSNTGACSYNFDPPSSNFFHNSYGSSYINNASSYANNVNSITGNNNSLDLQYMSYQGTGTTWVSEVNAAGSTQDQQYVSQHPNTLSNNKYTSPSASNACSSESMLQMLQQPYRIQQQQIQLQQQAQQQQQQQQLQQLTTSYQYNINNNNNNNTNNIGNDYYNGGSANTMMMMSLSTNNTLINNANMKHYHHITPLTSSSSSSSCHVPSSSLSSSSSSTSQCLDQSSERVLSMIDDIINGKK